MTSRAWHRAELARALFLLDPAALGGIWLRARAGPVRDRFIAGLTGQTGSAEVAGITGPSGLTRQTDLAGHADLAGQSELTAKSGSAGRSKPTAHAGLATHPELAGRHGLTAHPEPTMHSELTAPLPIRRIHPTISDDALFGGIDLTETLASGRMIRRGGVLSSPALLILPMAERATPGLAARLSGALDAGTHALIALDEGAEAEEMLPPAVADRLAIHLDLTDIAIGDTGDSAAALSDQSTTPSDFHTTPSDLSAAQSEQRAVPGTLHIASSNRHPTPDDPRPASTDQHPAPSNPHPASSDLGTAQTTSRSTPSDLRATSGDQRTASTDRRTSPSNQHTASTISPRDPRAVHAPDNALADLTSVALRLGIDSLRAPLLALRAARLAAALDGRRAVTEPDLILATELVLAPRATIAPAPEDDDDTAPPPPPPEDQSDTDSPPQPDQPQIPEDVLLEAAKAMLPPDLLALLVARNAARARQASSGAGDKQRSTRRGRPLPSRPGRIDGSTRIDVIATLRAAAPWQALRAKAPGQRLAFRPSDIRVKRYEERSERILIFAVDASGSAAFSRLAEAKGAIELLLAEAYARRDQVALIAFRGTDADLLLPPTRSLVQTKRRLAALPGGGGTPLAAGLKSALKLALTERAKGRTPAIALLTDGRANIALDGEASRKQAAEDATAMARAIRARGIAALVIDMGNRPERALAALAAEIDAPYLPMPRADSARLSSAVSAALTT